MCSAIACWTKWARASQLHEEGEETAGAELYGSDFAATTLVAGFSMAYLLQEEHKMPQSNEVEMLLGGCRSWSHFTCGVDCRGSGEQLELKSFVISQAVHSIRLGT